MPTQEYITLGSVQISGDLEWVDEFAAGSDLVGQTVTYTVTGAQIIQASAQQAGRRVTLAASEEGNSVAGALTRAQIDSLRALAAVAGAVYSLTLTDGRTFNVSFRRDDGPAVEARPFYFRWPVQSTDYYIPTIRLIMV